MKVLDNTAISKVLGQVVDYPDQYDPGILVREPRQSNRTAIEIDDSNLPFVGFDTWNAYEVSTLTENGLPVTGTIKVVYPCNSKYIVESKSLKLYLNSFNMYKCPGWGQRFVIEYIAGIIMRDLSELLETEVNVMFNDNHKLKVTPIFNLDDYITLENGRYLSDNWLPLDDVVFDKYTESPELLELGECNIPADCCGSFSINQRYHSSLLKSNCRVTSQPDWGDVYISLKSHHEVDPLSLLKYIISFRDECHFHEEICETIYKRLQDVYMPSELCVTCLYTRRGGIDINPSRASSEELLPSDLIDPNVPHCKTLKQ
jgi:7-cyano-7-deazaguanine reductase